MGRKVRGERSNIILNDLDMEIFKILINSKKDIAIMELRKIMDVTHSSLRRHLDWLAEIDLLEKNQLPKTRRTILKITKEGKQIYNILKKNVPNKIYQK
jgi:DNA-binding MarR family transcriptional regulator